MIDVIDKAARLSYGGLMKEESNITIDDLAQMVQGVAKSVDDLAIITKHGFDEVHEEMDRHFGEVDKRFGEVDKRFAQVDKRFDSVEKRLENLEQGQEEIKTVLGRAATKLEVHELDRRVIILEQQAGLS